MWGPWSRTWSFTPRGPSYPLAVTLDFDQGKGLGTLHWKPNTAGRRPAKYRVYGSDEKGFSVSDVPYKVDIGISKELPPQFPENFIAETTATELAVLGCDVALPAANKTYYRVVAVDEQGKRSGPSDYATAPRPVIYSKPALQAKVGAEYRGQVLGKPLPGRPALAQSGNRQLLGHREAHVCVGAGAELAQAGCGDGHALRHTGRGGEVRGGDNRQHRPGGAETG